MKKKILITVLGIGLALGAYSGYEYFGHHDHLEGGRCNPKGRCTACKNCSGCKHCAHNGGSCSVCRR